MKQRTFYLFFLTRLFFSHHPEWTQHLSTYFSWKNRTWSPYWAPAYLIWHYSLCFCGSFLYGFVDNEPEIVEFNLHLEHSTKTRSLFVLVLLLLYALWSLKWSVEELWALWRISLERELGKVLLDCPCAVTYNVQWIWSLLCYFSWRNNK